MSVTGRAGPRGGDVSLDRALKRVVGFLLDGLAHGHFELQITGDVVSGGRRRLTVRYGRTYQFHIPPDACERPGYPVDPRHGGDHAAHDEDAGHRRQGEPATGSVPPVRGARAAADA
jgi:hypothetical protein